MHDRELAVINHITETVVATRTREFFVKSDPEINIQTIAQVLVDSGWTIEEYSFGDQKREDGTSLGTMHKLVLRTGWESGKKDLINSSKLKDYLKDLFGK